MTLKKLFVLIIFLGSTGRGAIAQDASYTVGWTGGIEVYFTPDSEPLLDGDLMGGTLSLRSAQGTSLITFGGISMSDLHHVASLGIYPTVHVTDHPYGPHQAAFDSHLLITPDRIGGSVSGQVQEFGVDDLDAANPAGVQDRIAADAFGIAASSYQGDIFGGNAAFFLLPVFQTNEVDFARLVGTPGTTSRIQFEAHGSGVRAASFDFNMDWRDSGAPPTVTVDLPKFVEPGSTVSISPTISDEDDAIASVKFYDRGHLIPGCTFTSAPYVCEWTPTMSYDYGADHEMRVLVTDEAGNSKLSSSQTVTVFTTEPQVRLWTRPGVGNVVNFGDKIELNFATADPDGIAVIELLANGAPVMNCAEGWSTCYWEAEAIGDYELQARVQDANGFVATSDVLQVSFVEPFSIQLEQPRGGTYVGLPAVLQAEVTGRIGLVEFFVDNEPIPGCQFTEAPYVCSWTPDELSDPLGPTSLTARATDEAGHSQDSTVRQSVTTTIDLLTSSGYFRVNDRVLSVGESIHFDAVADTNRFSTIGFYANDELIPDCSYEVHPLQQGWFGCDWVPMEGDYTITVDGTMTGTLGEELQFRGPSTQRVAVIPDGPVGLGDGLPLDEDGTPILVLDFEPSCAECNQNLFTRNTIETIYAKLPVSRGGKISLVELSELDDPSEAFEIYAFETSGLTNALTYDAMPDSLLNIGRFRFDRSVAAGDYSATYQLVFDDGTVIRTKLTALVTAPQMSGFVPEPAWDPASIFVLAVLLIAMRGRRGTA